MTYSMFDETPIYKYLFAVAAAIGALLLTLLLHDFLFDRPFLLFIAAVALTAWRGGFLPGVFCALLAVLVVDYFLLEPHRIFFDSSKDLIQFALFMLVSALISWLQEERRRSERSLREVKEELEVILNGVADGITAQRADGQAVFANNASTSITGQLSTTDMTNSRITQLQSKYALSGEDGKPLSYDAMPRHKVFATGESAELTFCLTELESGRERWVRLTSAPVFDKQNEVRLAVNIFHDITDSRHIEEMRLENEQRLRKVIDNLSGFVGVMTPNGTLIEANYSFLQAAGLKPKDVLGLPFDQTYWWSYDEGIQQQLRDAIRKAASGETIRYDVRLRVKDDQYITIDFILAPIFNEDNEVQYLIPSGIDVTERNRLTDQIRLERRRLQTILNSVPGIVYEGSGTQDVGRQGIHFISDYVQQMLGYSPEVWKTSPHFFTDIIHTDDIEAATAQAREAYAKGEPGPVSFRCRTANGRIIHAEAYNAVMTDLAGHEIGTCGIILDVTERRRQEDEIKHLTSVLEDERERLTRIIGNVPGIVYENTSGTPNNAQSSDFISPYVEKILGYAPANWQERERFWDEIILPEDREAARETAAKIFESGEPGIIHYRCKASDGRIVDLESHTSIMRGDNGEYQGLCGVMMDITQRKQSEEAIVNYAEDLRRSNEDLEQFAYVASHDLQEPLRMVTSYLQLIEKRYGERLDGDAREFIDYAVGGASRMKVLINDLLAYSRVQRNKAEFELVSMEKVMEQVLHNLQIPIEDNRAVITHDSLPEINANRIQMVQLVQNLIGNALKFHGNDVPKIHLGIQREHNYWHFSVSDNGIGIEPGYLDRIFVIFQRLHSREEYPGTGIGLAICKKILDKHSGNIYAESTPGQGTIFHFRIPVKQRR